MKKRRKVSLWTLLDDLYLLLAAAFFIYPLVAHPLLIERGRGTSQTLTGDVTLKAVFVSQADAPWSAEEISGVQQELLDAARLLEQDADAYGAELSLLIECHQADASSPFNRDGHKRWVRQIMRDAPTLADAGYPAYRESPVIFLLNEPGRAFASSSWLPEVEYAILFQGDGESVVRHELLHLYGAEDYYIHSGVKAAAQELFPDSVMLSASGTARVDSLTAYLVGWTEEPDEAAQRMLADTRGITLRAFNAAREADQVDGYATISRGTWTYTGDLIDGTPHGSGVMRWEDGSAYDGQWDSGFYHGHGTLRWSSGDVYSGDFVRSTPHGRGTITWSSGAVYTGSFADGIPHGEGTNRWPDGTSYTGDVVSGSRTGWGMFIWDNGDVYTGEFLDGRITGQGVLRFADGSIYNGGFLDNEFHGPGCLTFADGSQRIGEWEHGYDLTDSAPE